MRNITKGTIIRTVCLVLALINQGLTMAGRSPLPIDDELVNDLLSMIFTAAAALWAWWKNNSFTQPALVGDEVMHDLKAGIPIDFVAEKLKTEE